MSQETMSLIDRKTASRLLRVSVRTVDRYIHRGVLPVKQSNGRILIKKKDVLHVSARRAPLSISPRTSSVTTIPVRVHEPDVSFYKDLYSESRKVLDEYKAKLEQATQRASHLESQIFHQRPLPQPSYEREERTTSASQEYLEKEIRSKEKELDLLQHALKNERSARVVFAVLTYALLILQPIFWYLLR